MPQELTDLDFSWPTKPPLLSAQEVGLSDGDFTRPPGMSFGEEALTGLKAGGAGLLTSLGGGLEAIGGGAEATNVVAELGRTSREKGQELAAELPPPTVPTFEEAIQSGPKLVRWLTYTAPQLLPYSAAVMGTAVGAAALAPAGAAAAVGTGAAFGVSYLLNAGEVFANLRAEGYDAPAAALAAGLPMAVLDTIVPVKILGRVVWKPAQEVATRGATRAVAGAIVGEATTEAAQEAIGAGTEALVKGEPLATPRTASRILNAFAAGAVGGAMFGGAGEIGARTRLRFRPGEPPPDTPDIGEIPPSPETPQEQGPPDGYASLRDGLLRRLAESSPKRAEPTPGFGLEDITPSKPDEFAVEEAERVTPPEPSLPRGLVGETPRVRPEDVPVEGKLTGPRREHAESLKRLRKQNVESVAREEEARRAFREQARQVSLPAHESLGEPMAPQPAPQVSSSQLSVTPDQFAALRAIGYWPDNILSMGREEAARVLASKGPAVGARAEKVDQARIQMPDLQQIVPRPQDGDFVFADDVDLQARWDYFNQNLFDGELVGWGRGPAELPEINVAAYVDHTRRTFGMSEMLGLTPAELDATILHEMAHAKVGLDAGHKLTWMKEARRLEYLTGLRGIANSTAEIGWGPDRLRQGLRGKRKTLRDVYAKRVERTRLPVEEGLYKDVQRLALGSRNRQEAETLYNSFLRSNRHASTPIIVADAAEGILHYGYNPKLAASLVELRHRGFTLARVKQMIRRRLVSRVQYPLSNDDVDTLLVEREHTLAKLYDPKVRVVFSGTKLSGDLYEEALEEAAPSTSFVVVSGLESGDLYHKDGEGNYVIEADSLSDAIKGMAHIHAEEVLRGMSDKQRAELDAEYRKEAPQLEDTDSFGNWVMRNAAINPRLSNVFSRLSQLHDDLSVPTPLAIWVEQLGAESKLSPKGRPHSLPPQAELDQAAVDTLMQQLAVEAVPSDEKIDFGELREDLDHSSWFHRHFLTLFQFQNENQHIINPLTGNPLLREYFDENVAMAADAATWNERASERLNELAKLQKSEQDGVWRYMFDLTAQSEKLERHLTASEKFRLGAKYKLSENGRRVAGHIERDMQEALELNQQLEETEAAITFRNDPDALATKLAAIKADYNRLRARDYFPYSRFGKWVVGVRATSTFAHTDGKTYHKGQLVEWEPFNTKTQRNLGWKEAKRKFKSRPVSTFADVLTDTEFSHLGFTPSLLESFKGSLNLDPEREKLLRELQFKLSPAASFRQHMLQREGTAGFSQDGARVYANYMMQFGKHVGRLKHRNKLAELIQIVGKQIRAIQDKSGDVAPRRLVWKYLKDHYKFVMNPGEDWSVIRGGFFRWYFIANPRAALVNLVQVPGATYGYLAKRHGDIAATRAISAAWTEAWRGIWPDRKTGKIYNPNAYTPEENILIERGIKDLVLGQNLASELAGVAQGSTMARSFTQGTVRRSLGKLLDLGVAPFAITEKHNRFTTFMAALQLSKDLPVEERYQAAADAVRWTQSEPAKWNRMPIARGRASIFLLFKTFMQNQLYIMARDKGRLRMWVTMLGIAGLMGLPGAEDVSDVIDFLVRQFTGGYSDVRNSLRNWLKPLIRDPDYVLHGASRYTLGMRAFNYLFGLPIPALDLSGSISLGRVLPGVEPLLSARGEFASRFERSAEQIGGPALATGVSFLKALYSDDPDTFRRWQLVMPPALKNATTALRDLYNAAYTDTKGNPLVPIDPYDVEHQAELIGKAMSFKPAREGVQKEAMWSARNAGQYWLTQRSILFNEYAHATFQGDREARADVIAAIRKYNRDAPRGMGIAPKDMQRAIETRLRNRTLTTMGMPTMRSMIPLYRDYYESYEGLE